MQKFSKYLPFALFAAFFLFGLSALIESKPSSKNERVYSFIKQYSPYYLEKRFGGLEIRSKEEKEFKIKPTNATLFKAFEGLEKEWGEKHLLIKDHTLIVTDDNRTQQASLPLQNSEEVHFIECYYGVKP